MRVHVHVVNAKNNYNGKLTNRNANEGNQYRRNKHCKSRQAKKDKRLMAVCVLVFVAVGQVYKTTQVKSTLFPLH